MDPQTYTVVWIIAIILVKKITLVSFLIRSKEGFLQIKNKLKKKLIL